jgi:hypothetical protein
MGILARQQVHQQLVEVIATKQRFSSQQRLSASPLGLHQGLHLASARPADLERLKGEQHATQHRAWPARATREQSDPPEVARKNINDETGFAVGIGMQHERRLSIDLVPLIHCFTFRPARRQSTSAAVRLAPS